MKEEALDTVLYELEQAEEMEKDDEVAGVTSILVGGYHSLICC